MNPSAHREGRLLPSSSARPAGLRHWMLSSLGRQIGATLGITMVLMLVGLAWLVNRHAAAAVEERASHDLRAVSRMLRDNVATYEHSLTDATRTLGGALQTAMASGPVRLEPARGDALPTLWLLGQKVDAGFAAVDRFTQDTGAVVTVFVRQGDDFVRVATSVRNEKGERVIGTRLAHESPAYARVLKNEAYTGKTRLFGSDYMTHYRPLHDDAGQLVGVLFVGKEYGRELASLKEKVASMRIGAKGLFFVVDNAREGEESLVIHPAAEGQPARALFDDAGLRALAATAAAGGGVVGTKLAARPGAEPVPTLLAVDTFPTWNWVVVAAEPQAQIVASSQALTVLIGIASLVTLLVILGVSWWSIRAHRHPAAGVCRATGRRRRAGPHGHLDAARPR